MKTFIEYTQKKQYNGSQKPIITRKVMDRHKGRWTEKGKWTIPPKKIKVCKQTENNDSQQEFLFILVTVLNEMD